MIRLHSVTLARFFLKRQNTCRVSYLSFSGANIPRLSWGHRCYMFSRPKKHFVALCSVGRFLSAPEMTRLPRPFYLLWHKYYTDPNASWNISCLYSNRCGVSVESVSAQWSVLLWFVSVESASVQETVCIVVVCISLVSIGPGVCIVVVCIS